MPARSADRSAKLNPLPPRESEISLSDSGRFGVFRSDENGQRGRDREMLGPVVPPAHGRRAKQRHPRGPGRLRVRSAANTRRRSGCSAAGASRPRRRRSPSRTRWAATFCGSCLTAAAARRTYNSVSSSPRSWTAPPAALVLSGKSRLSAAASVTACTTLLAPASTACTRSGDAAGTPSDWSNMARYRGAAGSLGSAAASDWYNGLMPLLGLRRELRQVAQRASAKLVAHDAKHLRIAGVECDLKTARPRLPIGEVGPHYRLGLGRMGRAQVMPQLVREYLQAFGIGDLAAPLADQDVGAERAPCPADMLVFSQRAELPR